MKGDFGTSFEEPVLEGPGDEALTAAIEERRKEVGPLRRQQLNEAARTTQALKIVLRDPPFSGSETVKETNRTLVLAVLNEVRESIIPAAVKDLSVDELDTLMKYLYAAFAEFNECTRMLKWHGAVVATGGLGTISRVLTYRTTA